MARSRAASAIVGAVLVAALVCPGVARAQAPSRSLEDLARRARDRPTVTVLDTRGGVWTGELIGINSERVVVSSARGTRVFPAGEVWEVWGQRRGSFWRGFFVGAIVGAGVAVLAQVAEADSVNQGCAATNACPEPVTAADAVAIPLVFAGIGGGIAVLQRHRTMIYLAPEPRLTRRAEPALGLAPGIAITCRVAF